MHIPDGFLDVKTAAATGVLSAAGLGVALWRTHTHLPPKRVPLLGLSAAFIFAAQMLNFPVAGGTSGHLIGGVLAGVLLGPGAAVVVLASVLLVQCFVFADGGVAALGANIFNMGLVDGVGGYLIYAGLRQIVPGDRGRLLAVAVAAWAATVLSASVCAGELAMSNAVPFHIGLPAMAGVHMLIGVGEALITTLVVFAVMQSRPELLDAPALDRERPGAYREVVFYGLLVAVGLAIFVSPLASSFPDGLEAVAARLGFMDRALPTHAAPLPDYETPGIGWAPLATGVAGLIGVLIVFALGWAVAKVLVPKESGPGFPVEPANPE